MLQPPLCVLQYYSTALTVYSYKVPWSRLCTRRSVYGNLNKVLLRSFATNWNALVVLSRSITRKSLSG